MMICLIVTLLIHPISRAAYQHESEFRGISTYRFAATKDLFASPDEFPENECYCVTPREPLDPTCAPTGVVRLRSCKTGTYMKILHMEIILCKNNIANLLINAKGRPWLCQSLTFLTPMNP